MKNIFRNNELKGIFLSLLLHSTLLAAFLINDDEPMKLADKEKTISIDLISYHPKKHNIEKSKPEPKPIKKIVAKSKPVKKIEPKHKPIVHKRAEPKPTKKTKDIELPKKDEPIQPKKRLKPVKTNQINDTKKQQQAFVKTNFTIIRDMVLSNLRYPNIAKRMGWEGTIEVKLVISKSGKLLEYSITKSSGKKHLDKAALKAVKSMYGKELPKPNSRTTILLPIAFRLN